MQLLCSHFNLEISVLVFSFIVMDKIYVYSALCLYLHLFVAKKHKEDTSFDELKSGNFMFSNGDRYGI